MSKLVAIFVVLVILEFVFSFLYANDRAPEWLVWVPIIGVLILFGYVIYRKIRAR